MQDRWSGDRDRCSRATMDAAEPQWMQQSQNGCSRAKMDAAEPQGMQQSHNGCSRAKMDAADANIDEKDGAKLEINAARDKCSRGKDR